MKFDAPVTRRTAVAVAAATLLLAGCGAGEPAGSVRAGSAGSVKEGGWTVELVADAPILNVVGEEGSVMPGECWVKLSDGTVQVQVAGSSIPEPAVEAVDFSDGVLTVTMEMPDEGTPATMDYVLHQFMIIPEGDEDVTSVELVRGDERSELPVGAIVELEGEE